MAKKTTSNSSSGNASVSVEQTRLLDYTDAYLANSEEETQTSGAPPPTNPAAGANAAMQTRKTTLGPSAMTKQGQSNVSQAATKQAAQQKNASA